MGPGTATLASPAITLQDGSMQFCVLRAVRGHFRETKPLSASSSVCESFDVASKPGAGQPKPCDYPPTESARPRNSS